MQSQSVCVRKRKEEKVKNLPFLLLFRGFIPFSKAWHMQLVLSTFGTSEGISMQSSKRIARDSWTWRNRNGKFQKQLKNYTDTNCHLQRQIIRKLVNASNIIFIHTPFTYFQNIVCMYQTFDTFPSLLHSDFPKICKFALQICFCQNPGGIFAKKVRFGF